MANKVTPDQLRAMHIMIDEAFFDGVHHTYMDIANQVGLSERAVKTYFDKRFVQNKKKVKDSKRANPDFVDEFPMITIVGRKETINGKVCHVYPSRMNF